MWSGDRDGREILRTRDTCVSPQRWSLWSFSYSISSSTFGIYKKKKITVLIFVFCVLSACVLCNACKILTQKKYIGLYLSVQLPNNHHKKIIDTTAQGIGHIKMYSSVECWTGAYEVSSHELHRAVACLACSSKLFRPTLGHCGLSNDQEGTHRGCCSHLFSFSPDTNEIQLYPPLLLWGISRGSHSPLHQKLMRREETLAIGCRGLVRRQWRWLRGAVHPHQAAET